MQNFPRRFPEIEIALTLWEPSEKVLQTLCVSWDIVTVLSVRVILPIFYIYFIGILRSHQVNIKPHNGQHLGYHTPVQNHSLATPTVIKGPAKF